MKKTFLILLVMFMTMSSFAITVLKPDAKGVWANATSELVQTDSVLIYFTRNDSLQTKSATLVIPTRQIHTTTVFTSDTILINEAEPLDIVVGENSISVNGTPLYLIENINIVGPYPQFEANVSNIASCLQQWQLGTQITLDENFCQVMIDTNNNSFMYMISPQMIYIRAASLRHTNKGSVFLQNIRMMKNMNTGEYTYYSVDNNYALLKNLPAIDASKFVPNTCTFANEGIYWSFISCEPQRIILNGCGEEYIYSPHKTDSNHILEWFEFVPQPNWLNSTL